jgi:hypothetical protein
VPLFRLRSLRSRRNERWTQRAGVPIRSSLERQSIGAEAFGMLDPNQRVVDVDIEVEPVLRLLGLWHPMQVEHRQSSRRLEMNPAGVDIAGDLIAKELGPERRNRTRGDDIDAHLNGTNWLHDNDRTGAAPDRAVAID